jgi:hypothetical protein
MYHDFYSNFAASVNAGDNAFTIDLLANELSDFVVYETDKFINTLNASGLPKVKSSLSDEEIIDAVLANIGGDNKLVKGISFQIAESNKLINNDKGDKDEWVKKIDGINNGLTPVIQKLKNDEPLKAATKKKIMEQIETKAKQKGNYNRRIYKSGKNSRTIWIVLGIAAIGVAAYLVYRYRKSPVLPTP